MSNNFGELDVQFIIETYSQKHRELLLKYQILVTALFTASIGFAIAFATQQIETIKPLNSVIFSLSYGLLGYFGLTFIFEKYFISIKEKMLKVGFEYAI